MKDSKMHYCKKSIDLIAILKAKGADRAYSVREFCEITGAEEKAIRRHAKLLGDNVLKIRCKVDGIWLNVYALNSKVNRDFFGVEL